MIKPYFQDEWTTIYCGDCMEIIPNLEDSVGLVVTDPPYFLPAAHYQTRTGFARNFADLGILEFFFKECFRELDKKIKNDGRMYMFCDGQSYPLFYYHLYPYFKNLRPLIWDKSTSINGYSWRHQFEIIIFCEKFDAKPIPSGDGDILQYRAVPIEERLHGAQKPLDLLQALIAKSTQTDSVILDPFSGSGSTGIAAKNLNKKSILIDNSEAYCEIAVKRLAQSVMNLSLVPEGKE